MGGEFLVGELFIFTTYTDKITENVSFFTHFTKPGGDCDSGQEKILHLCHHETAVLISQEPEDQEKGSIIIYLTIPKYAFASVWCGSKHYSNITLQLLPQVILHIPSMVVLLSMLGTGDS